jgi:phosphopantothenoylcysteine synthetase/decarboxylase
MKNPSLREESREQLAEVIPVRQESSILDWLESSGKLLAREGKDEQLLNEEEEISELMGTDDNLYDDDDDDDDALVDDE